MKHIAYLDPGTGTLIVQAVLGGAAGAAVLFKTKGRRFFKKNKTDEAEPESAQGETDGPSAQTAPAD
jgi:hypothetical protein